MKWGKSSKLLKMIPTGPVIIGLILLSATWAVVLAHREFANVVTTSR